MSKRIIYDSEGHYYFITFSCYKRRRLLNDDQAKRIVISIFGSELEKGGGFCHGFVIMPDHVHAVLSFNEDGKLSNFMKHWKQRSSFNIKKLLKTKLTSYGNSFSSADPVWQARYYCFNIFTENKFTEKIEYMHNNPVKAGLVEKPVDWLFSSSRHYYLGKSVGIPIKNG